MEAELKSKKLITLTMYFPSKSVELLFNNNVKTCIIFSKEFYFHIILIIIECMIADPIFASTNA